MPDTRPVWERISTATTTGENQMSVFPWGNVGSKAETELVQGSTIGTLKLKLTDPGNEVADILFNEVAIDAADNEVRRSGPHPPDITRRPGWYEKDVVLDASLRTRVEVILRDENGTALLNPATAYGEFGVRTASAGGTGQVRVRDANTPPVVAETLAIEGATVGVANRVATFNLDGRYPQIEHTHPYLPLNGGLMTGTLQVQKNTVNVSYQSGHAELRTTDGSAVGVGFHRAGFTAVTLRHAVNGTLDLVDHNGTWAQYRGDSFYAGANRFYGGDGAFVEITNGAAQFITSGAAALQARVGGLLVSDAYAHAPYVPANGIWAKGSIVSAGSVSAAGGKLSTGGASAGVLVSARQANTHAWEIYNSGGTLGWHSGQYSVDTMTLTQGGLLAVAALTARDQGDGAGYDAIRQWRPPPGESRGRNGGRACSGRGGTDNNTYLNYGGGGYFFIRDSASVARMIFDPNGTGFTTWIQARGANGHDLRLGGYRTPTQSWISSTPNLHLDSPNGWNIYLNYESDRPVNIGAINQSTHKLAVSGDALVTGWFRNKNSDQGLYNEATGRHVYSARMVTTAAGTSPAGLARRFWLCETPTAPLRVDGCFRTVTAAASCTVAASGRCGPERRHDAVRILPYR
jgi:hypothetical protein